MFLSLEVEGRVGRWSGRALERLRATMIQDAGDRCALREENRVRSSQRPGQRSRVSDAFGSQPVCVGCHSCGGKTTINQDLDAVSW